MVVGLWLIVSGLLYMAFVVFGDPLFYANIFPKYHNTKFNTAISLAFWGMLFLLRLFRKSRGLDIAKILLSLLLLLLGSLTLAEYAFNVDLGIDQFFAPDMVFQDHALPYPGRPQQGSAVMFVFAGLSFLLLGTKSRQCQAVGQYCNHLLTAGSGLLIISLIFNDGFIDKLHDYGPNFLYCSIITFFASIVGAAYHPSLGIVKLIKGPLLGQKMARRFLAFMPAIFLVSAVIKIKYLGFKIWQFDSRYSLFILVVICIILIALWHIGRWLNKIDLARLKAELALENLNGQLETKVAERTDELKKLLRLYKESEDKFRSITEQSLVGIFVIQNEKFIYVNPCFAFIFGYIPEELINVDEGAVSLIIAKEYWAAAADLFETTSSREMKRQRRSFVGRKKDGTTIYLECYCNLSTLGGEQAIVGTLLDVTDRKIAEREIQFSEIKYKWLFDHNPQPSIMVAKDDLSIIDANEAAAILFGYPKEELLNNSIAIFRPMENIQRQKEMFDKRFLTPKDLGVKRYLKKDKTGVIVNVTANDIVLNGRSVRILLFRDVTNMLATEDSLKKTYANLKAILDTTKIAYFLLDVNQYVLELNQTAIEFIRLVFNVEIEKGGHFVDYFPPERASVFENYSKLVLQGRTASYEVIYQEANGTELAFNTRIFPVMDNEEEILGMLVEMEEVTEKKKYLVAIETQNKKLREIAWFQSHVLRAPVSRMIGIINLFSVGGLSLEEKEEFLNYLATSANEIDTIIKEINSRTSILSINN